MLEFELSTGATKDEIKLFKSTARELQKEGF